MQDNVVRVRYSSIFKKWWSRTTALNRTKFSQAEFKLRKGINESKDGRPKLGKAKALKGLQEPIYEIRVDKDLRLIYSLEKKSEEIIILINRVLDHDNLTRGALQSVEHLVHGKKLDSIKWGEDTDVLEEFPLNPYFHTETDEIIDKEELELLKPDIQSKFKKMSSQKRNKELSNFFNRTAKFYNPNDENTWSREEMLRGLTDACIWEKTVWNKLLSDDEMNRRMIDEGEFLSKLVLKPKQIELLNKNDQIFILEGVAGTGKTTLLEERFLIFINNNDWKGEVLFLTHNAELSRSVKSRLKQRIGEKDHEYLEEAVMDIETWYRKIEAMDLSDERFNQLSLQKSKCEKKISKFAEKHRGIERELKKSIASLLENIKFIEIHEYRNDLEEQKISTESEITIEKRKILKIEDELSSLENNILDNRVYIKKTKFKPERKITYDVFSRINAGKNESRTDQGILWEEYRGVILGHGDNFSSFDEKNELTWDEYKNISRDRGSYDDGKRKEVFDEIQTFKQKRERFGGKYSRKEGGWIDQEQAKYTQNLLENNSQKYKAIFIDEIQDLTELQISIMLNLLVGLKKFEVAGDTSQSVYPSAFRWADLRKQVYKILEQKNMPEHHRMDMNYRSTPYLVAAANFVLDENEKAIDIAPTEIKQRTDRLEKGTHPLIIRLTKKELIFNLKNLELPNVFCPLLVRNEKIISELSKSLASNEQKEEGLSNPHVMSIPECKGLEYENVIIWDPCSGSEGLLNKYYHHKKGKMINQQESIALELRHMFVGITRARYRLALIGPKDSNKNKKNIVSGLGYFERKNNLFSKDAASILENFAKKDASIEDFIESAKDFEDRGKYVLAADAYTSAHRDSDRFRCRAIHYYNIGEFEEAARYFENAANEIDDPQAKNNLYQKSSDCLDIVMENVNEDISIEVLESKGRLCAYLGDEIGSKKIRAHRFVKIGEKEVERRMSSFKNAADLFYEIDDYKQSLSLYKKIEDYRKVAEISIEINSDNDFFGAIENLLSPNKVNHKHLYSIYSGNESWKRPISKSLGIRIEKLPESNLDVRKQLKYANEKQTARLDLEAAKNSNNWNDLVQAYKKLGRFEEASNILIENGKHMEALRLLIRVYSPTNDGSIKLLLETMYKEGRDELYKYYNNNEKISRKARETSERIFPKSSLNQMSQLSEENSHRNIGKENPYLKYDFQKNIFLRDMVSSSKHPMVFNNNLELILRNDLVRILISEIRKKNEDKIKEQNFHLVHYFHYLYERIPERKLTLEEAKEHYPKLTGVSFISSIISLENELLSLKDEDEILFLILTQMYATMMEYEKIFSIKDKNFTDTMIFARFESISYYYLLYYDVFGDRLMKFKKSFDFIHFLYIHSCAKILEETGISYDDFGTKFSYNTYDAWSSIEDSEQKETVANILGRLEKNTFRISMNMKFQKKLCNHGKPKYHDIVNTKKLVFKEIVPDYSICINYVKESKFDEIFGTGDIETFLLNDTWFAETYKKINELSIKKNFFDDLQIENDHEIEEGSILEEIIEEEIIEEEIIEEEIIEEEIIEEEVFLSSDKKIIKDIYDIIEFPFDISFEEKDPLLLIKKLGDDFLNKCNNDFNIFREMNWNWKDDINKKWQDANTSDSKIILIAGRQYLLDKNKSLDRMEKNKPSNSELIEHRRRAGTVQKELIGKKLPWANRALVG